MKTQVFLLTALLFTLCSCSQTDSTTYLKEVIQKLETIQSASYECRSTSWSPYSQDPIGIYHKVYHEYHNPKDTTIGACYARFIPNEDMRFDGGYNGKVKLVVYPEHKGIMEDDFTARPLSFRNAHSPFFNNTRNILQYALETTDSIQTTFVDEDSCYHFSITIFEDTQVEFFGKAVHLPAPPPGYYVDPVSHYEIWINKSTNLPYKYQRKMSHNISQEECINPTFNKLSFADFNLYSYIPEDYEVRKKQPYNAKQQQEKVYAQQNKPAPQWTLIDTESRKVSLKDIKSKVILLNFTGIGCGACQEAVPYLKELKNKYPSETFELVAIESWSGRTSLQKDYAKGKGLNYLFLGANEEVLKDYQTGRSAPWFFILDENRIIRKVFNGYSQERTGKEITQAIEALL